MLSCYSFVIADSIIAVLAVHCCFCLQTDVGFDVTAKEVSVTGRLKRCPLRQQGRGCFIRGADCFCFDIWIITKVVIILWYTQELYISSGGLPFKQFPGVFCGSRQTVSHQCLLQTPSGLVHFYFLLPNMFIGDGEGLAEWLGCV